MDFLRGVLLLALLAAPSAFADIFSPGELSAPHASLSGVKGCPRCHTSGKELAAPLCLSCHSELEPRIAKKKGFHGRLAEPVIATCWSCHREHQGRNSPLIPWGPKGQNAFDHRNTGWPLNGHHAKAECQSCHQPKRLVDPLVRALLEKQPKRKSFLGLPNLCVSCHADEHRGQLGQLCRNCHQETGWRPAPGFNHTQDTEYPLLGLHKKVLCKDCHTTAKEGFLKFLPVDHAGCASCHRDVHEGKFGARCESCHSESGWKEIKSNLKGDRDFHQKTRFPLKGRHQSVECASCHGPTPGHPLKLKGLAFSTCSACHQDAHLGQMQLLTRAKDKSCDSCHTEEGFLPTRFTLERHSETLYPLEESHRAVSCEQCHRPEPSLAAKISKPLQQKLGKLKRRPLFSLALFDFKRPTERCETCHADVHEGQFAKKEGGCTHCHALTAFTNVRFDHTRDSRFPLTGKHAAAACGSCHAPDEKGQKVVRYRPLSLTCAGCHTDVHAAQLSEGNPDTDCERCHTTADFKKTGFLHQPPFTEFLLDGKHAQVSCAKCHPALALPGRTTVTRYKPLPKDCAGCHEDFHHGGFEGFAP
jgi:hypothetical protein